jgi:hypothetical protein
MRHDLQNEIDQKYAPWCRSQSVRAGFNQFPIGNEQALEKLSRIVFHRWQTGQKYEALPPSFTCRIDELQIGQG